MPNTSANPVEERWLIEGAVWYRSFRGILTKAEMYRLDQADLVRLDQATRPIHYIVDVTQLKTFPPLHDYFDLRYMRHVRIGHIVSIGIATNSVMRMIFSVIAPLTRMRYRDCRSVDEALLYLRLVDATLETGEHAIER